MKVLITGFAGFIGSYLTELLLNRGYEVVGIDNFNSFYNPAIKRNNIKQFQNHVNLTWFDSNINNDEVLRNAFQKNIDVVMHLAASAGVRPSMVDPVGYASNNITEYVALLNAMQKHNVNKMVFASSSSVYGNLDKIPFTEDMNLDNVQSPYAATKLSSEIFNKMYFDVYGISIINLRFFTVYGPRQRPDLAIHKFTKMILGGETIQLYGNGELERDYTYVEDTVSGVLGAIERISKNNSIFETYNLGNNTPIKTIKLVEILGNIIGKNPIYELCEIPKGDVKITYADISKAQKCLNYNPQTNLEEGLRNFWEWYKNTYL